MNTQPNGFLWNPRSQRYVRGYAGDAGIYTKVEHLIASIEGTKKLNEDKT